MSDYELARKNMVQNQLRTSEIEDARLITAMGAVPRERFLPKALRGVAYNDEDIALPDGRFLIEPLALAKMLQAGAPQADEVGMVIGCQTGYAAAVLAQMMTTVFLMLSDQERADVIEGPLNELSSDNVVIQVEAEQVGFPQQSPFDFILLGGGVDAVPETLLDQLGDGGRLACIMREGHVGRVTIFQKVGTAIGQRTPFDAHTPRMMRLAPEPAFQF
ncbi:MAG: protein-L-isoaspartate O-methyltransferase [Pseudomonadota bacterium]